MHETVAKQLARERIRRRQIRWSIAEEFVVVQDINVRPRVGTFAACFGGASAWPAPTLIADGSDSVWGLYLERGGFMDGRGEPLTWPNGSEALVYFEPLP